MIISVNPPEMMEALLSMIEPHGNYKGGMISYTSAKEYYDYATDKISKLENTLQNVVASLDDTSGTARGKFESSDEYQDVKYLFTKE